MEEWIILMYFSLYSNPQFVYADNLDTSLHDYSAGAAVLQLKNSH